MMSRFPTQFGWPSRNYKRIAGRDGGPSSSFIRTYATQILAVHIENSSIEEHTYIISSFSTVLTLVSDVVGLIFVLRGRIRNFQWGPTTMLKIILDHALLLLKHEQPDHHLIQSSRCVQGCCFGFSFQRIECWIRTRILAVYVSQTYKYVIIGLVSVSKEGSTTLNYDLNLSSL